MQAFSHTVRTAETGEEGISQAAVQAPDVIVLDLGLPDMDGIELCRRIRAWSEVPVVVLSADGSEDRKVEALGEGADDYMTKPFGIDELLARVTALLRRSRPVPDAQATPTKLTFGSVVIDLDAQLVTKDGRPVHLTPTEFALLRELALASGKLLSHAALLRKVWGPGYETETEYTRVYVRRLRAKLEDADGPPLIATEPRAGYRMLAPDA
jgi:two-component system, OmpR family, KDP operon response regulator KdpE